MQQLKIGLYGGSFDPIHHGHLSLAQFMMHRLKLDKLIWIPSYQSHDGKALQAPAAARLEMCELISKQCQGFSVSAFEIEQAKAVFTIDTLNHFKHLFPQAQLYWLMGADQALRLNTWQNPTAVLQLAKIVIYPRADMDMPAALELQGKLYPVITDSKYFAQANIIYFKEQPLKLSGSSALKQRLADNTYLEKNIPSSILSYIQDHHLYKEL